MPEIEYLIVGGLIGVAVVGLAIFGITYFIQSQLILKNGRPVIATLIAESPYDSAILTFLLFSFDEPDKQKFDELADVARNIRDSLELSDREVSVEAHEFLEILRGAFDEYGRMDGEEHVRLAVPGYFSGDVEMFVQTVWLDEKDKKPRKLWKSMDNRGAIAVATAENGKIVVIPSSNPKAEMLYDAIAKRNE